MEKQRLRFVTRVKEEGYSIAEACRIQGVSRVTGHKWLARYKKKGRKGLLDLDRCPLKLREPTSAEIVCKIVKVRIEHPHWGGRTIRGVLKKRHGIKSPPHSRTIDRILKRSGFVVPRIHQQRVLLSPAELVSPSVCNELWSVDFKGWWNMRNKKRCNPLTVQDGFSRFLIELSALADLSIDLTKARFIEAFKRYGLPLYILSDNGNPFATTQNMWGLTRLSVWWLRLGITPLRIEPGKPYQNGRHERMHLNIARELESHPERNNNAEQKRFDDWRDCFNNVRPHQALEMQSPADIYKKSTRKYSAIELACTYPSHWEPRKISHGGHFSWGSREVQFSTAFAGEFIGIEPVNNSTVRIWYADYFLGTCDRDFKHKVKSPLRLEKRDKFLSI